MTIREYLELYGSEMAKIATSDAVVAGLQVARDNSPMRKSIQIGTREAAENSVLILGQIQGAEWAFDFLFKELALALPDPQARESYADDTIIPPDDQPEQP